MSAAKRFAMTVVVEGKDPEHVWEDVSATLGDGNNLLEDGHSAVFLGDPFEIVEKEEYNSGQVAYAILSGVQRLRDGLPVRVHNGEELRSALDQIQSIAYDGVVQIENEAERHRRGDPEGYTVLERTLLAKLQRIVDIAEAGEPDEDWETISGNAERMTLRPCGFCASDQPVGVTHCGKCGAFLRTSEEAKSNRKGSGR